MEKGFDSWILVCVVFRFDCWSGSEVVCVVQLSGLGLMRNFKLVIIISNIE